MPRCRIETTSPSSVPDASAVDLGTQSDGGFAAHRKTTRRDVFLAEMDKVVPWAELCAVIEPFYPKPRVDGGGRPTVGLERMLRIHDKGTEAITKT